MEQEYQQIRCDSTRIERFLTEIAQQRWQVVAILPLTAAIHEPPIGKYMPIPVMGWELQDVLVVLQRERELT